MIALSEAKEQLGGAASGQGFTYAETFKAACKLGVEALTALEKLQAEFPTLPHLKLPSQEKE